MKETDEDAVIIKKVLKGDINSFEIIINKYKKTVGMLVSSKVPGQDVLEITHDVFIRAYKSLPGYNGIKPFEHWLKAIAVRACHDFWRARYRNREAPVSRFTEKLQKKHQYPGISFSANETDRVEVREILDKALNRLKPTDRMILLLIYFDGYSVKETAEFLSISRANVKIRAFRARKKLKKIMETLFL